MAGTGEGYDRCGSCDTEVEANFLSGGTSQESEKHLEWNTFHCPPQAGGCGSNWSRTTRQGLAKRDAQGESTSGLTESAITQRAMSLPSDRYQANYGKIDWGR
jgi:hypothetical protein